MWMVFHESQRVELLVDWSRVCSFSKMNIWNHGRNGIASPAIPANMLIFQPMSTWTEVLIPTSLHTCVTASVVMLSCGKTVISLDSLSFDWCPYVVCTGSKTLDLRINAIDAGLPPLKDWIEIYINCHKHTKEVRCIRFIRSLSSSQIQICNCLTAHSSKICCVTSGCFMNSLFWTGWTNLMTCGWGFIVIVLFLSTLSAVNFDVWFSLRGRQMFSHGVCRCGRWCFDHGFLFLFLNCCSESQ